LLVRVAALVVVTGAVQADAQLPAEAAYGGPAGADALGLEQVISQPLVGPVGAIQALFGRPFDDPALEFVRQIGGDLAGCTRGLARADAVEPAFEVRIEPALDGARTEIQIRGDVLVGPVAAGQAGDLDAVPVLGVGLFAEGTVRPLRLPLRQADADHPLSSLSGRPCSILLHCTHRTVSPSVCIRSWPMVCRRSNGLAMQATTHR
jgi:hypothetical protein